MGVDGLRKREVAGPEPLRMSEGVGMGFVREGLGDLPTAFMRLDIVVVVGS
jgi:hypothetical protein